mmetsp:Transcript_72509/g.172882  ORF Transcript_72509/g.172882 Transcript_72509/m.172882 type:complete len:326 (-) Transcript_72509:59-1036(-)
MPAAGLPSWAHKEPQFLRPSGRGEGAASNAVTGSEKQRKPRRPQSAPFAARAAPASAGTPSQRRHSRAQVAAACAATQGHHDAYSDQSRSSPLQAVSPQQVLTSPEMVAGGEAWELHSLPEALNDSRLSNASDSTRPDLASGTPTQRRKQLSDRFGRTAARYRKEVVVSSQGLVSESITQRSCQGQRERGALPRSGHRDDQHRCTRGHGHNTAPSTAAPMDEQVLAWELGMQNEALRAQVERLRHQLAEIQDRERWYQVLTTTEIDGDELEGDPAAAELHREALPGWIDPAAVDDVLYLERSYLGCQSEVEGSFSTEDWGSRLAA